MTEALASRVAGLKLAGIVASLVLPMMVLSYFMVQSVRHDMSFTQREMLGMQLNRLAIPVILGAAANQVEDADFKKLQKQGTAIAAELGTRDTFDRALATLITSANDQRYAVAPLAKLMIDSATSSNIIFDPYAESYHLGAIVSQKAPSALADLVDLWTISSRARRDGEINRFEMTGMLMATGAWSESQLRVGESISASRAASPESELYKPMQDLIDEMDRHPAHLVNVLEDISSHDLTSQVIGQKDVTELAPHIVLDFKALWDFSSTRFENILSDRLYFLQTKFAAFLSIAAAACIIGVGSATFMFRSTLRKLDDVTQARSIADAARLDAETSAAEVQRINEEIVRLNSGLSRNIEMLRDAQDESVKKGRMAQLGQLTATVAHELRNPLGAVRTSVFLLERKVKGKGLGIEAQIDRINNGVTRCDTIISQLLDFARTKPIQPETLVFDDWLAKLIEEEAQEIPAAVAIECDLGLGNALVPFDPARMRRVLINLISNASEAVVGKGESAMKPGIKAPLIVISTRNTSRGVELSVVDNGPGIAAENIEKIFEPLFTTKNFGTGLGLPAVQKIMEQHGGGLEVRSNPGQGAEFTAWWPAQTQGVVAA